MKSLPTHNIHENTITTPIGRCSVALQLVMETKKRKIKSFSVVER